MVTERYDMLLFDTYFCDLIVTGLPELPRLGLDLFGTGMGIEAGGTFNAVRALHRLGIRVGWACDFGNDLFSKFVLSEVAKEGVDMRLFRIHDQPVRVFSLAFSYAHDRGFISYMDHLDMVDRVPYIKVYRPKAVLMNVLETGQAGWRWQKLLVKRGQWSFLIANLQTKRLNHLVSLNCYKQWMYCS